MNGEPTLVGYGQPELPATDAEIAEGLYEERPAEPVRLQGDAAGRAQ